MSGWKTRGAHGQARIVFAILAAVVVLALVLPAIYGSRAERIYRESVAQLSGAGRGVRLASYRRGWFSSRAVISVSLGRGAVTLIQHVHHGPLALYNGAHVAFPVAAVVDTDPPTALENTLDKVFGEAPLRISTVVAMSGALDTYITRPKSERTDPATKVNAKFGSFNLEAHSAGDTQTIDGGSSGATATGVFGEAQIAGLTIHARSHRDPQSTLWLGGGELDLARVSYSIVGGLRRAPGSGLVQDIRLTALTEIRNGRLNARESLSVGNLAVGALELKSASLATGVANVPPQPVAQFKSAAVSISQSTGDPQLQSQTMQREMVQAFVAIVKGSPIASVSLKIASARGDAAGTANFTIAPELVDDPMLQSNDVERKDLIAQAWKKYGQATVNAAAPVALLEHLATPAQLKRLEQNKLIVREGDKYTCRATFKDGGWLINGHKAEPPMPTAASGIGSRSG